jgi:hypothetical protein
LVVHVALHGRQPVDGQVGLEVLDRGADQSGERIWRGCSTQIKGHLADAVGLEQWPVNELARLLTDVFRVRGFDDADDLDVRHALGIAAEIDVPADGILAGEVSF